MNNLYHKIAVASVFTALSFTLGTNKGAKAATFNLTATKFFIEDIESIYTWPGFPESADGLPDRIVDGGNTPLGRFPSVARDQGAERGAFYEFNIGSLSLPSNTFINKAIFQHHIYNAQNTNGINHRFPQLYLQIFGYVGNGKPDLSDFGAGVKLGDKDAVAASREPASYNGNFSFDVTLFINERARNRDDFAGFGIRVGKQPLFLNIGQATLSDYGPYLTIETVDVAEPVPEPTTIFGSALALGVGGWLKRKKSSQQNKTTSQH